MISYIVIILLISILILNKDSVVKIFYTFLSQTLEMSNLFDIIFLVNKNIN